MTGGCAVSKVSGPKPNVVSMSLTRLQRWTACETTPGARLHRLRGDREGQWAVAINEQYRIVFDWNDGPANAEIADYHR